MYSCEIRPDQRDADSVSYAIDVGKPSLSSENGRIDGLVTVAVFTTTTAGYPEEEIDKIVIMATSWNNLGEEVIRKLKEISRDRYATGLRNVTRLTSIRFEVMSLLVVDDTDAGKPFGQAASGWADVDPNYPPADALTNRKA